MICGQNVVMEIKLKDFLYINYFYSFTESDKKNAGLSEYPDEIIAYILYEQVKQGNKLDLNVFKDNIDADLLDGGFDWDLSKIPYLTVDISNLGFWNSVLIQKDFDLFFDCYPIRKNSYPKLGVNLLYNSKTKQYTKPHVNLSYCIYKEDKTNGFLAMKHNRGSFYTHKFANVNSFEVINNIKVIEVFSKNKNKYIGSSEYPTKAGKKININNLSELWEF